MTQVIASIPARYIRYNAVLSKNLDRAMAEVNRLQQAIDGMPETENTSFTNNTTTAMTFGGLGEDVGKKKQLGPVTTSVLKPNHRKALIFYHMMDVLLSVWQSVWIKFGPSMRQYHAANSKSLEAVEQAEHFLNVFHMWRKTMDMGKLEAIQKDGTFQYKTFLSRKNRYQPPNLYIARPFNPLKPILSVGPFQKATPAGVDIFALKSSTSPRNIVKSTATNSVAVYEASASMTLSHSVPSSSTTLPSTKLKSTNSIDKRMLNLVGKSPCSLTDREILQKFRKSYVTALVQTGAYKDKDMDSLLEELLSIQGPELFDENLIEDYKFPTHFIRTQIRREFKLNSWKQSVMEADSSTTSARSHHKQAKTPLAATATTTTTAVQTEASGRVMYASSKKKVMLTTGNNNGVLSASTESLGRIMSQSDAYRIKTKSMASFMDSSTSLANLTKSGVDLHFNLMNENRPPSQLSIYGRQESIVSSPTSLQQ